MSEPSHHRPHLLTTAACVDYLLTLDDPARAAFLRRHPEHLRLETIEELKDRVNALLAQGPAQALRIAVVARQVAALTTDPRCHAKALWAEGNALVCLDHSAEARDRFQQARAIYQQLGEDHERAALQVGLILALSNLAEFDPALAVAQETAAILEAVGDRPRLANVYRNIGIIHGERQEHASSIAAFEQAQQVFRDLGDEVGAAIMGLNIAHTLTQADDYAAADALLQQARLFFVEHALWAEANRTNLDLGVLRLRQGRFGEALTHLEQARAGFARTGQERLAALAELDMTTAYLRLNLHDDVIAICDRIHDQVEGVYRAVLLLNEAVARRELGQVARAAQSLAAACRELQAQKLPVWEAHVGVEQAALAYDEGRYDEARDLALRAQQTFAAHDLAVAGAHAGLVAARCLLQQGAGDEARARAVQALRVAESHHARPLAFLAHRLLGQQATAAGDPASAIAHYAAAIQACEATRQQLGVDDFRTSFLEDKLAVYQEMVWSQLQVGQPMMALAYAERAKARALVDLLADAPTAPAAHPLRDEIAHLEARRDWLCSKLDVRALVAEVTLENEIAVREAIQRTEAELLECYRRLQIQEPLYPSPGGGPCVALDTIQAHLDTDTLLVEYFVIAGQIVAFLVSANGLILYEVLGTIKDLTRPLLDFLQFELEDLRRLPRATVVRQMEALCQQSQAPLQRLHEALLAPLAATLARFRRLVIVPHDVLYYLPFHAFYDGSRYLIDTHEVSYAPSATVFVRCRERKAEQAANDNDAGLVLGYAEGDDLPAVQAELAAVQAAWPTAQVLCGSEATVQQLRERGPTARLVHLAAHGEFRRDNPLFSALRLAGGQWLLARQVYDLNLRQAALVTLSGCETGVSRLQGGDLLGLARGFFCAGAPTLVVSLWAAHDAATAHLMAAFYRALRAGAGPPAALRAAQLAVRDHQETHAGRMVRPYAHPYYWAPFVVLGAD